VHGEHCGVVCSVLSDLRAALYSNTHRKSMTSSGVFSISVKRPKIEVTSLFVVGDNMIGRGASTGDLDVVSRLCLPDTRISRG
jgi:hypothetical protein